MAENTETLSQRMRRLMDVVGLTEEALAGETGLSQATISNYLRGKVKNPPEHTMRKIAVALRVSPHYLMTGKENEQPLPKKDEQPQKETLVYFKQHLQRDGAVTTVQAGVNQFILTTQQHIADIGPSQHAYRMLFGAQNLLFRLLTRVHDTDELWRNKPLVEEFVEQTKRRLFTEKGEPDIDNIAEAITRYADFMLQLEEYEEALRLAQEAYRMTNNAIRMAEALRITLKALTKLDKPDLLEQELLRAKTILPKLSLYQHEKWCLHRAYAVALATQNLRRGYHELLSTAEAFQQVGKTGYLRDHLLSAVFYTHLAKMASELGGARDLELAKRFALKGQALSEGRYNELKRLCSAIATSIP
jgi:transcriptional regulator with XRE-family HTH domain